MLSVLRMDSFIWAINNKTVIIKVVENKLLNCLIACKLF